MGFLVACGVAATHARPVASPRPVVILVHGRGQLGQDTASLRREWKRDLDSSLKLVGIPALPDEDVRLAWYADVLDPDSDSLCDSAENSDSLGFGDVARGFLALISSAVPNDDSREVRGLMGDLLYALDAPKRCAAERRVGGIIASALREKRPVIVVAYSLGSLVTYGYLRSSRAEASPGALRLVTIGSPLGVRVIRELVFGESVERLTLPGSVTSVENVYDPNDFLSAPLEGVLSATSVRDDATHASERDDPHNLTRYLRDRATGAAVMRALCASTNDGYPACAAR
jgi:hypothetical protein